MVLQQIPAGEVRWQKADIAAMTNDEISRLNYDAMVDLVLASELPVRDVYRIRSFEGETISRLVHMARDYCRNVG